MGDPVTAVVAAGSSLVTNDLAPLAGTGYVALYDDTLPGGTRVVGFGAIQINLTTIGFDAEGNRVLEIFGLKLPGLVAPENASAQPSLATDVTFLAAPDAARASLLAPILAR